MNVASVNTAGFILRHKTDKMCGPAWSLLRNMCNSHSMCSIFVEPEFITAVIDFIVF